MNLEIFDSKIKMGEAAANAATEIIGNAIKERGEAYIIAATGASHFEFIAALVTRDIDWEKTIFFHLDEYVGLSETHPASFRRYLKERIAQRVHPKFFNFIDGSAADAAQECSRVGKLISKQKIDVAFVGIGENGHLAFNDPPADFEISDPYIVVNLDDTCRKQQVGEGWFKSIDEVPTQAISMSIQQILKTREILCIVPDRRKAEAVRDCLEFDVTPMHPASILQTHEGVRLYLDLDSASLLNRSAHSQLS